MNELGVPQSTLQPFQQINDIQEILEKFMHES